MRSSPPIRLDDLDLTIQDVPRLRAALGPTFAYFSRVENEVAAEPLMAMLPRLGAYERGYRSYGSEFLDVWVGHENAHGAVFDALQRHIGEAPIVYPSPVLFHNRVAGALGKMSSALHAVFEMVYLARGAMHERSTLIGYDALKRVLGRIGERGLQETLVRPIRAQEVGHLAYYTVQAQHRRAHLAPWQLAMARRISVLTYAPVGASAAHNRAPFGHVALALSGEDLDLMAVPVQAAAERLLNAPERPLLPGFVKRALVRCVEAAADCPTRAAHVPSAAPVR